MLSVSSATVHPPICPSTSGPSSNPTRIIENELESWEYNMGVQLEFSSEDCQLDDEDKTSLFHCCETSAEDIVSTCDNSSVNVDSIENSRKRRRVYLSGCDTEHPAKKLKIAIDNDVKPEEKIAVKPKKPFRARIAQRISSAVDFITGKKCSTSKSTGPKIILAKQKETKPKEIEQIECWDEPTPEVVCLKPDDPVEIVNNQENNCVSSSNNNNAIDEKSLVAEVETPFYMNGFPNPPGENLCWLNATLHALFVLPLIDSLDHVHNIVCSKLIKALMIAQDFWMKGSPEKQNTYQAVRDFKQQLEILDESYSSEKQQDVSEFLMILLNYIKSEYEGLGIKNLRDPDGDKNVYNGVNNQLTPKKRSPFTDISPQKTFNNRESGIDDDNSMLSSQKRKPTMEYTFNPIDEVFTLKMAEHYSCQYCMKHRERDVDNLMLYIDLPGLESETVDLYDAIVKSMKPEERELKCDKCKCNKHNVYTTFRECPNVLMVQINRYGMTDNGILTKINTPVDIPNNLILSINNKRYKFQPICIISHVGSSIDCGHYTSYIDSHHYTNYNQWFHYNDLEVTAMSKSEALTAAQTTVYLAFFILDGKVET